VNFSGFFMVQTYFQYYLELAHYFIELFSQSNIVFLEFSIYPENQEEDWHEQNNPYCCEFFASLVKEGTIVECHESSEDILQLYSFNPETLVYTSQNYCYPDFLTHLFTQFPFLKDSLFLTWFRQWLPQEDSSGIAYLTINRDNPEQYMNAFLQPLRKIRLFNYLSGNLISNVNTILVSAQTDLDLKKI